MRLNKLKNFPFFSRSPNQISLAMEIFQDDAWKWSTFPSVTALAGTILALCSKEKMAKASPVWSLTAYTIIVISSTLIAFDWISENGIFGFMMGGVLGLFISEMNEMTNQPKSFSFIRVLLESAIRGLILGVCRYQQEETAFALSFGIILLNISWGSELAISLMEDKRGPIYIILVILMGILPQFILSSVVHLILGHLYVVSYCVGMECVLSLNMVFGNK